MTVTGAMRLRLVCWNLHGPPFAPRQSARFRDVALYILRSQPPLPEVVLFQEVWFPSKAELLIEALSPRYEPIDVPRPSFPFPAGGLLALLRRDSGWQLRAGSFEPFRSMAPSLRFWEGDGLAGKGFQRLDLQHGDQPLIVFNTHLQAQYGRMIYDDIRADQMAQLNAVARALPAQLPVLAAGDLNTRAREPLYERIVGTWIDLTRDLRESCGNCGTTVRARDEGEWIDYVLARRSSAWTVQCESAERIKSHARDEPFSDHHGLDLSLRIEPAVSLRDLSRAIAWAAIHGPASRRQWLAAWALLGVQRLAPGSGSGRR